MSLNSFFLFILCQIAVAFIAHILLIKLHDKKKIGFLDYILRFSTLFFSIIVILQIFLGSFKILSFNNILIALLLIIAPMVAFSWHQEAKDFQVEFSKKELSRWQLLGLPLFAIIFVRFLNALIQVPLEYDNVAYHLPFVVEWMRTGDLLTPYYSAFASPIAYYPSNFELLDLWLYFPFNSDLLVNIINFPIAGIFALCLYKICRNFGLSKSSASITTLIPLSMPVFLRQMGTPLVDLFFSLCFLLALYFLQEINNTAKTKRPNYSHYAYFGLALGLFVGTKYLGIVYGALLLVAFFILALRKKSKKGEKKTASSIAVAAGTTILTGGFFYIRNWIDAGNPLFPVEVELFGLQIFPGYLGMNDKINETSLIANFTNWENIEHFMRHFYYMTGLQSGLISAAVALCAILIIKNFSLKKSNESKDFQKLTGPTIALILATIAYFALYLKAPYTFRDLTPNVRYAMMFLLTASIMFGLFLKFTEEKYKEVGLLLKLIAIGAMIHGLLKFVIFPPDFLLYNDRMVLDLRILEEQHFLVFINIIRVALGVIVAIALLRKEHKIALIAALIAIVNAFFTMQISSVERERLAPYFYQKWYTEDSKILNLMHSAYWLNENAPYANVAYTGFNFHYHLFGRQLQREVHYVNINDCFSCRYIDFADSPDSIRRDPNFNHWLTSLRAKNKTHLVIEPHITPGVKSYELEWAQEYPDVFKQVYNKGDSYIFEIH